MKNLRLGLCLFILTGMSLKLATAAVVQGDAAIVHVAVASNFLGAMEKIADAYQRSTGKKIKVSYGATGKLFAQIQSGAPFHIFLSADQKVPEKLIQLNLALKESRFTYATGKIVLWSLNVSNGKYLESLLKQGSFKFLAIAHPQHAPYGRAAKEVLEKLGLWNQVQAKLVLGENIAQTYHFVASGNADMGIIAFSQLRNQIGYWDIPIHLYTPIKQDAVILKKGENNRAVHEFMVFLKSQTAKEIILNSGYY